ncbi:probable F420-dependent oxidoreductase, Rv1855c family [Mycolicibacterium rutilum]|uniref:Probable F420-dependent oxidoreductase, Rv1855c family n=1 Tax=Mycolicibacterium rutilum TaxID=370526 RepID=A0A1H6LHY7_MYCRU|nr:TIGR03560 family F420-dependent LLM class oxidoreductase [Mycolicibacterium rutilum]SEH84199.1 probable F420-dependent oxidoreductase, Rv1855c family [Mycolicibacterium rutilum]
MQVSAKLAPTFDYPVLERFWRSADELGFPAVWNYDHFYGLVDPTTPTLEGWTSLSAMAVVVRRARVGCLVSGVTYRNPAVLAKMAVTVDHISGGRLDFGIGAGWHEDEHRGYGIDFPSPGERVAMVDEALTVIRRLWTEDTVDFDGRFYTLRGARCDPKPLQQPHPPIVVGASQPKMLAVAARHADEWNMPSTAPQDWATARDHLDRACRDAGRDPSSIRRGVQLFLHPDQPEQVEAQLAAVAEYANMGCEHVVLSFYQPPGAELLQHCAEITRG